MGHPDKLADQISDGVLDALIAQDPMSRVACETMVTTGLAVIAGEITTKAYVDMQKVVREVINDVGYTESSMGISADHCAVLVALHEQSPDIAMGVDREGAGDQGLMFGYACNDTDELMPLPISLAHKIINRLTEARFKKEVDWLRPDSKSQVTIEFDGPTPVRVDTIVVSTQHDEKVKRAEIEKFIRKIVAPILPSELVNGDISYHVNPTGQFITGGPHGDCGLTGRKIIVDTYGGWGRHGGGAFSGKDPSKVDRSAAYMGRWVAKNIVAAGVATHAEIQFAYAIGHPKPVSVRVETFGTAKLGISDEQITEAVQKVFSFKPADIVSELNLLRPIYRQTTNYGHFGKAGLPWEKTDKVAALKAAIKGGK